MMSNGSNNQRELTWGDLQRLTVGGKDRLCLDGRPIEVQKFTLTKWQSFFAIIASIGVMAQAIIAVF